MKLNMIIFPPNDWLLLFFWSSKNEIQKYNNNIPDINYLLFFTFVFFFFFIINLPLFFLLTVDFKDQKNPFWGSCAHFFIIIFNKKIDWMKPCQFIQKICRNKDKILNGRYFRRKGWRRGRRRKKNRCLPRLSLWKHDIKCTVNFSHWILVIVCVQSWDHVRNTWTVNPGERKFRSITDYEKLTPPSPLSPSKRVLCPHARTHCLQRDVLDCPVT